MLPSHDTTSAAPMFGASTTPPLFGNNATNVVANGVHPAPSGTFVFGMSNSSNTVPLQSSNPTIPPPSNGFGTETFQPTNPFSVPVTNQSFGQSGGSGAINNNAFGAAQTGFGNTGFGAGPVNTNPTQPAFGANPSTFGSTAPPSFQLGSTGSTERRRFVRAKRPTK